MGKEGRKESAIPVRYQACLPLNSNGRAMVTQQSEPDNLEPGKFKSRDFDWSMRGIYLL